MPEKSADEQFQTAMADCDQLVTVAQLRQDMALEMGGDWDRDHPGWRARFVEYFNVLQNKGQGQVLCATVSGEVVAMAAVTIVEDYHSHTRGRNSARINMVYVQPAHRRRGIGRKLMQAALDWLKEQHCEVVRLNASEDGKRLYESIGFKPRNEMEYFL